MAYRSTSSWPLVPSDEVDQLLRRAGLALAVLGLAAAGVGAISLALGGPQRTAQMAIGGLVTALVGAMLLLFAPDTLPPEERP